MAAKAAEPPATDDIDRRIARQLGHLRAEQGWSLDGLADRSGISRATLSRLERGELSPSAAMLGRLCTVYGWTLSRLMAEAEGRPPTLVPAASQTEWTDPESGYTRRMVSPPAPGWRGELVEVRLPAGATVTFDTSPVPGLEHHLWMLQGSLSLTVEGATHTLGPGDCLRYALSGPSTFLALGRRGVHYLVAIVRP
jgi:transcriptional regulator with XRE-family HTH domain